MIMIHKGFKKKITMQEIGSSTKEDKNDQESFSK